MHTESKSLKEVHSSISTDKNGFWKKLFAFLGPAYLISVGYMDPGNWATDIAAGSKYGYALVWVLVLSNLIALLLQSLSARLGLVRGLDLAQASRASYPKTLNFFLWVIAELAIAACDLAEVIGMALGLNLLLGVPLLLGVGLTILDTFILLFLVKYGMRKMEAFIIGLIAIIGIGFLFQMFLVKPSPAGIARGLIPTLPDKQALYVCIAIIGATVMPHNLYLHSSLVQTRKIKRTFKGILDAIRYNFIDTFIALNLALFVNAAILILAAAAFFSHGLFGVSEIQDAHKLLSPMLGNKLAPAIFALALIAAGQSSTLTGTLSGQIVMEGYLNLRIAPWLRRIITRLMAVIPAFLVILLAGESKIGDLLILSQVILCLQLGFAVIPLIHFVSDKKKMGRFVIPLWVRTLAWISALLIIGLNIQLIYQQESDWISASQHPVLLASILIPLTIGLGLVLLFMGLFPFLKKISAIRTPELHASHQLQLTTGKTYRKIVVPVDFSFMDSEAISHATAQGKKEAEYLLIHIVETAGAQLMEEEISDNETGSDERKLEKYKASLEEQGYRTSIQLGFGNPKTTIPDMVNEFNADLLVMGAHGHKAFEDILFGTTLDAVRHQVHIPVLIVTPPVQ
ncbi:MAG TPA: Nramp family divalent metal transporter [Bacteroidia bacterium]|jgi:manganese transport protein|nr:Nramp family divalent metal transporter [Bacteroidia bacterium]